MQRIILILTIVLFSFLSCKKKSISCDNAELRVKNTGTDTIYYAFNSSAYTDTLLPGATISHFVGPIEVADDSESTVTTTFQSTHGSYAIEVDDCVVVKEIN